MHNIYYIIYFLIKNTVVYDKDFELLCMNIIKEMEIYEALKYESV